MKRFLLLLLCFCLPLTVLAETPLSGAYYSASGDWPCLVFHTDGTMEAYSAWQTTPLSNAGCLLAKGSYSLSSDRLSSPLSKKALPFSGSSRGFTLTVDSAPASYLSGDLPAILPTREDLCLAGGWYDTEGKTTYHFQLDGTLSRTKNYHEKISAFRYDAGRLNAGGDTFLLQYACRDFSTLSDEQAAALDKQLVGFGPNAVYIDQTTLLCWQIYQSRPMRLITLRRRAG